MNIAPALKDSNIVGFKILAKIFTRGGIPSKIFTRSQMTFQNIHPQSDDLPKCNLFSRSPALMHLPFWPFQKVDFQYLLDPAKDGKSGKPRAE